MKRLLITGANGGIGRAVAAAATAAGYDVIATARGLSSTKDVLASQRVELDVASDASVGRALAEIGDVDVLVNNAGVGIGGPTEVVPIDEARRLFEVNVFGTARMIRALLPQMRGRGSGTIVNISSLSARVPWPFGGYYAASKAAVEALSEAVAAETEGFGVRVLVVEPGVIDTGFGDKFVSYAAGAYAAVADAWTARFAGEHPGPEAVAHAIIESLTDDANGAFRIVVGKDAERLLRLRRSLEDVAFIEAMQSYFGISAPPAEKATAR